jgi:hypothetical protein
MRFGAREANVADIAARPADCEAESAAASKGARCHLIILGSRQAGRGIGVSELDGPGQKLRPSASHGRNKPGSFRRHPRLRREGGSSENR